MNQYSAAVPPAVPNSTQLQRREGAPVNTRFRHAAASAYYHAPPPLQQQLHSQPQPPLYSPVVVQSHPQQVTKLPPPLPPPPPAQRPQYQPPLPWYSAPGEPFPARRRRRRRKAPVPATPISESTPVPASLTTPASKLEDKQPSVPEVQTTLATQPPSVSDIPTPATTHPPSEAGSVTTSTPISTAPPSATTAVVHKVAPAIPIPALPAVPIIKPKAPKAAAKPIEPKEHKELKEQRPVPAAPLEPVPQDTTLKDTVPQDVALTDATPESAVPSPPPAQPKSWAEVIKVGGVVKVAEGQRAVVVGVNGDTNGKAGSLVDILNAFQITSERDISSPFLEPRGLVNTGNMCFMNAVLQMLVFCGPFYYFLDHLGKQVAHSFKGETPLIDAMIMFMREFRVLSPTALPSQVSALKVQDLESFGGPFAPEFLYDVLYEAMRNHKSFAHMRRGQQQDAEEFLGFLLDGLHEEAVKVMSKGELNGTLLENGQDSTEDDESGWFEVGHKHKTVTTRTMEKSESPITKIFGGKQRSEWRVSGLKPSVTFEPYTPLQLDIQAPEVRSVTDALKHLTVVEKLQGNFNPSKGPSVAATKQLFLETLPLVLILHLKRFQYDNTNKTQKIWKKIAYPLVLEIPPEAMSLSKRAGPPTKYRLIGVVYHHGKSASGGHYTVDVQRQDAKNWIRLDDTVIKRISADEVKIDVKDLGSLDGANEEDQDGWVNAAWEEVNGNGPSSASRGEGARYVGKDSKVAYILFYQKL